MPFFFAQVRKSACLPAIHHNVHVDEKTCISTVVLVAYLCFEEAMCWRHNGVAWRGLQQVEM
jgi:hypothetical protein